MPDQQLIEEGKIYKKRLLLSLIIPGIIVFFMWIVKVIEVLFGIDLSGLGIYPLNLKGIPGIVLSPLIHANFKHLTDNTLPLFLLSVSLFFFYREIALKIFSFTWISTGILVWLGGRPAWHIGASGLVYGLASFLFFSGIIRKYYRLIGLSLLVVFLYGEMVWGIFPDIYKSVSWESHMLGVFSGILLAIIYRKQGPQEPVKIWIEEDEDNDEDSEMYGKGTETDYEKKEGT